MKETKAMEGMESGTIEKSEKAKGPGYEMKESPKHIKAMAKAMAKALKKKKAKK